jgi:hypothetical protein
MILNMQKLLNCEKIRGSWGKEDYLTSFRSSEETGRKPAVTSQEIREHQTDCLTKGRSPWQDRAE